MTTESTPRLFPLFLRLHNRDVLVVGGGTVAERKIDDLAQTGARVRVVALETTSLVDDLAKRSAIVLERRAFVPSDVDGAWLVIAATNDPTTQANVSAAAERARTFAVAVDDPPNGSAYTASVIRRGPVTAAISTSGEAPALARLLREVFEEALPEADWVDAARALRERWRSERTPMTSRFAELVRAFKEKAG